MRVVLLVVAGVLVLLAACAQTSLSGAPLENSIPGAQETSVTSPRDSLLCPAGAKLCDGKCVTGCCTDSDCTLGTTCQEGTCANPPKTCGLLEKWNATANDCTCTTGNKWCKDQGRCIPAKACCAQYDCTIFGEVCGESVILSTICAKDGPTNCKSIREGATERYELATTHTVRVNKVLEGNTLDVRINGADLRNFSKANPHKSGNATFTLEKISVTSGECRRKL